MSAIKVRFYKDCAYGNAGEYATIDAHKAMKLIKNGDAQVAQPTWAIGELFYGTIAKISNVEYELEEYGIWPAHIYLKDFDYVPQKTAIMTYVPIHFALSKSGLPTSFSGGDFYNDLSDGLPYISENYFDGRIIRNGAVIIVNRDKSKIKQISDFPAILKKHKWNLTSQLTLDEILALKEELDRTQITVKTKDEIQR